MSLRFITILLCLISVAALGQYEVLEAKKVKKQNGEKVKKRDFLSKTDTIFIAEKGHLTLDVESAMHMKLAPGIYHIGSESTRHNEWYGTHLELTKQLKRKGMIMCKFKYKTLVVPGSDRHYEIDRIELDQKGLVNIQSDTSALTISWVNPDYTYKGGYHLVVRDFYNNGFIDIIEIGEEIDSITFYPGMYGHKHMYYNIIADDCRASLRYKIQVNSPNAYSHQRTNFLKPDN
ncbi:hypothetical protein [Ekhidna sp.]|uniref:hypothetical protein n=1 Tax=Ekhidna sp. TaxID=2608089 RepID=UPI003CCB9001